MWPLPRRAPSPAPAPALLLLLPLLLGRCAAIQWLALSERGGRVSWNETRHCRLLLGAGGAALAKLCRRHLELMPSAVKAARDTRSLCRAVFADMRWDCSALRAPPAPDPRPDPRQDPAALLRGSRESAFVHALSAASVSHSFARACASRLLPRCSCAAAPSEEPPPDSRWGGCGDDLRFGLQLGAAFADGPAKSRRLGTAASRRLDLHNNAVGRQVLTESLHTKCKCHGVSGSCSVKTCWKSLQNLAEIAFKLKSKYLTASRVAYQKVGGKRQLVHKGPDPQPLKETQLVYLIPSPDYCVKNMKLGSLGTENRRCNKTSEGTDSCSHLCCGRGYNTYIEGLEEKCHCRYHWCCYVLCKKCQRTVERYVCK